MSSNDTKQDNPAAQPALSQKPGRKGLFRRLRKEEDGAATLEFALVATPFIGLLFALFEVGANFAAQEVVQNAADEIARQVRTGQVQSAGLTAAQVRNIVCDEVDVMLSCDASRLGVEIRRFTGFSGSTFANPRTGAGALQPNYSFQPGGPNDMVIVRVFYVWDVMTPMFGPIFGNTPGAPNKRLLQAASAFRNEPF